MRNLFYQLLDVGGPHPNEDDPVALDLAVQEIKKKIETAIAEAPAGDDDAVVKVRMTRQQILTIICMVEHVKQELDRLAESGSQEELDRLLDGADGMSEQDDGGPAS